MTMDFNESPTYRPGDNIREPSGRLAQTIHSPDEPPELDSLLNRLFSTAEELARAEARLSTFADRLGGPIPECDQSACAPKGSSGFAGRMDALHSSLTTTLIDINSTISRLERLA
jgi:hypothetical protein